MLDPPRAFNPLTGVVGLVREIRPWQWYKQGVMFLGITFSKNLLNVEAWADLFVGVLAFTAVAGATYVFNDINDVDVDRNHPDKQHRPIASGQISVPVGAVYGGALVVSGLGAAYFLGPLFLAVLVAYLAQNVLYSIYLKRIVFVDVLVIAIGFVFRAIAGVIAIDVFLSPWLIVTTFLLALVLALGKRRTELVHTAGAQSTRDVLGNYTTESVDQLLAMTMATLLMAYTLYTFSRSDPTMMVTLPLAFFGVFRYHYLLHTTDIAAQPWHILSDDPSMANLVSWALVVIAILYEFPNAVLGVIG